MSYVSDPLDDFTLIKFLDRFVYKNPKLKESDHGGSAMQVSMAVGSILLDPRFVGVIIYTCI